MVEVARRTGASAKFAGSGGAIVGTYPDEATFAALQEALGRIGCVVIKPAVAA
jgi:glucuronokinase